MEEDIQYPEAAAAAAAASSNGGKKEEDGTIDVLLKMMNEDREKTDILDEGGLDQLCTNEDIENIVTKNLVDPDKSSESKVGAAALPGGDDVGHTEKKKAPTVRFAAPLHTHTRDDSPEARASKLEQLQQQQLEYLQRQQLESEESEKKISASSCQNNDDQEDECLGILYQMINEDMGGENGDGIIITLNEETLFQCSAMGDNGETLEGMDGLWNSSSAESIVPSSRENICGLLQDLINAEVPSEQSSLSDSSGNLPKKPDATTAESSEALAQPQKPPAKKAKTYSAADIADEKKPAIGLEKARLSHKDDVMGSSVTANNADAKLSSLAYSGGASLSVKKQPEEQVASIRCKHVMGPKRENSEDQQSSSSADSSESSKRKRDGEDNSSASDSGYGVSNYWQEDTNDPSGSNSSDSEQSTSSDGSPSKKKKRRSHPLEPSFNGSNESATSSDSGQQEEKDLLVCFQDGEKAGEELSFCPKVTSESDEKAYGSDGSPTSSSDDPKVSSTNSTSSEDGAGNSAKAPRASAKKSRQAKRHLEGGQETAAKRAAVMAMTLKSNEKSTNESA